MSDNQQCGPQVSEDSKEGDIFKVIPKAMAEIEAIGKNKLNRQQNWKFRGIDDVYNTVNKILAKHGIFTVPKIVRREKVPFRSKSGTDGFHVTYGFHFRFYASDGSYISAEVDGEAMDYGDKAVNKCMSIAHKYAFFQVFAIPTEDLEDPDKQAYEVSTAPIENTTNGSSQVFRVSFGKYKGQSLDEIGEEQATSYAKYIEDKAAKDGKPIQGPVKEFIDQVKSKGWLKENFLDDQAW